MDELSNAHDLTKEGITEEKKILKGIVKFGNIDVKEIMTSRVDVLGGEESPILSSLGQVLAEDVRSDINIPPLDNSAMDGYAVRAADSRGASEKSPRVLRVIDTIAAGSVPKAEVEPGTADRIMTGAPIPKGADAVVRFEHTDQGGVGPMTPR